MKKIGYAITLSFLILIFIAGCGGSSGGSGSDTGESGTNTGNTGPGSVTLAWDAPVNSDGLPLPNVAGYKVYYGTSSRAYETSINNGMQTTCTISGLAPGTYYIAVTSYDASGNESPFSNEASKIVQ